jgi:hypothetical protein
MMAGQMLGVRKPNIPHIVMRPGGKLETDEAPLETLAQESCMEELGCILIDGDCAESSLPRPRMNRDKSWKPPSYSNRS